MATGRDGRPGNDLRGTGNLPVHTIGLQEGMQPDGWRREKYNASSGAISTIEAPVLPAKSLDALEGAPRVNGGRPVLWRRIP
jgi:hypothetical protein